jgi:hypothetical protein
MHPSSSKYNASHNFIRPSYQAILTAQQRVLLQATLHPLMQQRQWCLWVSMGHNTTTTLIQCSHKQRVLLQTTLHPLLQQRTSACGCVWGTIRPNRMSTTTHTQPSLPNLLLQSTLQLLLQQRQCLRHHMAKSAPKSSAAGAATNDPPSTAAAAHCCLRVCPRHDVAKPHVYYNSHSTKSPKSDGTLLQTTLHPLLQQC